jgi:hypothetical protein
MDSCERVMSTTVTPNYIHKFQDSSLVGYDATQTGKYLQTFQQQFAACISRVHAVQQKPSWAFVLKLLGSHRRITGPSKNPKALRQYCKRGRSLKPQLPGLFRPYR